MKISRLLIIFSTLFIVSGLFASDIADRIVATVGDEIILESELRDAVEFTKLMSPTNEPDSILRAAILNELIKNRLILEEAKKESVEVGRSEVDDEVEKNISLLKERFDSEADYQEALKNEGITEKSLRDRYRDDIRKRLVSQKLLAKNGLTDINITPTEIKKFYELHKDSIAPQPGQVALGHILFMIKPSQDQEQAGQKKITEIFDIISRGGDFEEVAKSFSDDPATKDRGGYFGKVAKDLLQPEVQAVISNMKAGEVSSPFRSRNGYEIIKFINQKGDKVELSHILVKVKLTRQDTLDAKKTAQNVRNILLKGANFDSLAKIYSGDPMTKDSGGYLGEFLLTGLQEPFRSAIEKMPAGAISEPVLSEHGYHLIKILARQEDKLLTLEDLQDQIRNYLFDEQLKERLDEYLAKIAAQTYIAKYF